MPPSFEPREPKSSTGPIVGVIIIVVLMLAGAVYFWYARTSQNAEALPYIPGDVTSTTSAQ